MLLVRFLPFPPAVLSLLARATTANSNQAFSVEPTGNWDGNDGGWSTFAIRVGTPPQVFRILPSTGGSTTYIPLPDNCSLNSALCGSARGVEPFNAAPLNSSVLSGTPSNVNGTSVDPGKTCTSNRSPMCSDCDNSDGRCTSGPCNGRNCCGTLSTCISTCMGLAGICTGQFIGCPCTGPDYNAGPGIAETTSTNPSLAQGYQYDVSSSWAPGLKVQPILGLPLTLGIHDNGLYGAETVGLGADANTGLTLQDEHVVGVNASSFYIGSLGLGLRTDNSSLLGTLFNQNMTSSVSYGYTAGALYQQPPVLGSLTLGGYDSARVTGPNLTSPLRANDSSVMVGVGAITLANALAPITTLLSIENNLTTLLDTTLPYTYLPLYVCQQLEQAFGLQWDATHDMYLINDTTHQQLLKAKPTITFTFSTALPEPAALNVTLPYAAFDLTAAYPIFPNGTNYFPLRRANNSAQFVLGRAFMQEAYLFVDYQMAQFTVAQAAFPASGVQNIITVDRSDGRTANSASSSGSSNALSVGAIAGIAVGASIGTVLLCTLGWLLWRARHPKQRRREDDVWRAPVSKGPSANSSGSGPEKSILSSSTASRYSSAPAFKSHRSNQPRSRAPSDYQKMSQSTSTYSRTSSTGRSMMPWRSPSHSRKSSTNSKDLRSVRISHPTLPMHNGKAMPDVDDDPWQTSALDPPAKAATKKATPPTGHTRMFSILDEKETPDDNDNTDAPLSRTTPSLKRAGLPKLNTSTSTQDIYRAPKEWETPKEWDTMDVGWSPSPLSPPTATATERPPFQHSHSSQQRPSRSQSRNNSLTTIIVDPSENTPSHNSTKPSVAAEASKIRQKHIWEMQASANSSPGGSRGPSPSRHRSKTSTAGIGYHPSIPEIPPGPAESLSSQAPTPAVSPGPEAAGRRRHIWELQSPGGSRGNSRKHSRAGTRDLARDGGSGGAGVVDGSGGYFSPSDPRGDGIAMPGTAI